MRHEIILPADETAPGMARSRLDQLIPPSTLNGRSDDARVAITELAANAVLHGHLRPDQDVVRLIIDVDDDHVRVEIEQPTEALRVRIVDPRLGDPDRVGGFGLRLVQELADDWGHDPGPPGIVWFELRR
jgi:anti-sigma regulatory factor (Ser/Thr protein kinase)